MNMFLILIHLMNLRATSNYLECLNDLLPERHSEVNDVDIHPALEYDADRETDSDICHPKVSIKPQRHKRTHKFIFQKRNQQYHMN